MYHILIHTFAVSLDILKVTIRKIISRKSSAKNRYKLQTDYINNSVNYWLSKPLIWYIASSFTSQKGDYRSSDISELPKDSSAGLPSQGKVPIWDGRLPGLYTSERILISIRGANMVITAIAIVWYAFRSLYREVWRIISGANTDRKLI